MPAASSMSSESDGLRWLSRAWLISFAIASVCLLSSSIEHMASAKMLQIPALLLHVEVLAVVGADPSEVAAAVSVSNCVASISFVYNAPNSICMRTEPPTQAL